MSYPGQSTITLEAASALRAALVMCSLFIWCAVSSPAVSAEPKKVEDAKPGNCTECHGGQKVFPAAHVKTEGMHLAACNRCHRKSSDKNKSGDLRGKMSLSHAHQLSGVTCSDCHGKEGPAVSPEGQKCLVCHTNYKTTVTPTEKAFPNPHDSHMGDLDCLLCHHSHFRSENFCAQCHRWKFIVP